jgi:hypothetical protein
MSSTSRASAREVPAPRITLSVPVALGLVVAYAVVFTAVAASSGIPYAEWFATGGSAFRTAVLPLVAGAVLLVAFLWWARWDFGLFHLTNVINGSPLAGALSQVGLAAVTGVILYLYRRARGLLVVGMVAHGLWDISLFLPGGAGGSVGALVGLALLIVVPALGICALVVSLVRDRQTVVAGSGVVEGVDIR